MPASPFAVAARRFSVGRAGAVLWALCFQFFVAEQIARLRVASPYSMARNYISDLGATRCFSSGAGLMSCSPLHALMNASFIVQGLLISCGAILVRGLLPRGRLFTASLIAFAISGIGVLLVGLNPEDRNTQLHLQGATIHFLGGALAMLLMGVALLRERHSKVLLGTLTLFAGTVALAATILLGSPDSPTWTVLGWGIGTVERIAAYPLPLWLTCAGLALLVAQRRRAN